MPAPLALLLAAVAGAYLGFPHLPFQDLPAHAGLLALRERLDGSALLAAHYQPGSLLGPYGLFLGLGHLLAGPLGAERAVRVVAASATLGVPLALLAARRWLFARRWAGAGYLGLVLALGFATALGLSSFLLGQAALLLAVGCWLALVGAEAPERRRRVVALAGLGVVVAVGHGFAFVLLALVVAIGTALTPRALRPVRAPLALLPGALLLAWAGWRDRGFYPPPPVGAPLLAWAGWTDKLALPFLPTLLSRWGVDVLVAVVVWLLLGAATAATLRARPDAAIEDGGLAVEELMPQLRRRVLAGVAVVLGGLALLAPTRLGWFGSVDLRLLTTGLLLATLVVDPARQRRWLRRGLERASPALALAMTATLLAALAAFQGEARGPAEVLARVPAGARLLHLPVDPGSRVWAARPFLHADKQLLLDRDVVLSDLWQHAGSALRARPARGEASLPPLRLTATGDVDWTAVDLARWDYALLRGSPGWRSEAPQSLELVAARDGSWLFRVRSAGSP
jgi:hypothetical protein